MMTDVFVHGFFAEGVAGKRTPCEVVNRFYAACNVHEEMAKLTDYYLTMFAFPHAFVSDVMNGGQEVKGYEGCVWSPFVWFDIDRENDLPAAIHDTVKLVEHLISLGLDAANIQVWFSGSKGFHVGIPISMFGESTNPSPQFHAHCKAVAIRLSEEAGIVVDRSVYDRVRLFRCPNTRHSATGLFKVPVTLDELKSPHSDTLVRQRAAQPRALMFVSPGKATKGDACFAFPADPVAELEARWLQITDGNLSRACWQPNARRRLLANECLPCLRRKTVEYVCNGAQDGERANRLFQAAADFTRCGLSKPGIYSLLSEVAKQTGLSITEIRRQILNGIENQKKQGEMNG